MVNYSGRDIIVWENVDVKFGKKRTFRKSIEKKILKKFKVENNRIAADKNLKI